MENKTNFSPFCCRRREFLGTFAKGVSLLGISPALVGLMSGCGSSTNNLPTISNNSSGAYPFAYTAYPALQTAGGSLMVNIAATSGTVPVAIVRTTSADVVALDATCTHQGCLIGAFDSSAKTFTCPCHGSVFTESGSVQHGPASSPLHTYTATISDTEIAVAIS